METSKHAFAIDYPEPLVHFALSLGVFSDPAVCKLFRYLHVCCLLSTDDGFLNVGSYLQREECVSGSKDC